MTDALVTLGNARVRRMSLTVPNVGVWCADIELSEAPELADGAAVELHIGATTWRGTVAPGENGAFALTRKCMVRGGAGAWSRTLPAKHYHNDFGVRAQLIAEDLCRETGETLGSFVPASERLGVDYVRQAATDFTAAGTLSDVIGGVPWWVAQDGTTSVGLRPATQVNSDAYELLAYDPRLRMATLGVADSNIAPIQIGATLVDERLDRAAVIREYTVELEESKLRVQAYCGGDDRAAGNLAQLMTSIVRRIMDERLTGRFRYRVVNMRTDGRVDLQAVNRASGVPDLQFIAMWPGVAGAHAELTPGAEVLVEFIEGDRAKPILTGFGGKQAPGFVPVGIVFGGSTSAAARVGDVVAVAPATPVPPATPQTITLAGAGAGAGTYTFSFSPVAVPGEETPRGVLLGTIVTGSPKVKL
jgi:hypothetical protein